MLRIGTVVLGVDDVGRAAEFWARALGYVPRDQVEEDWAVMVPASGPGTHVALQLSETPVQEHPRIHLDLYAGDAADQAAEVERLVSLCGARRLGPLPGRSRLRRARRPRRQPLLRHRHRPRLSPMDEQWPSASPGTLRP